MKRRNFPTRRDMVSGTALLGLTAVAAGEASDDPPDSTPENEDPKALRFVETEHVRTYYALARN